MKIAHVSAGAAGMLCGTCIHNNTLARALIRQGHDVSLIPIYTPIRTDESSVAIDRVFYGAINAYLQHASPIFRRLPRFLHWLLDRPRLLELVSKIGASREGSALGPLTLSLLEGEHGPQVRELESLVDWLENDLEPDVVHLSLSLFLGFVRRIKERLGVPVVCELQGEDIFFDDIAEPYRSRILEVMRERAADVDVFIAPCEYYADLMSRECGFPADRIEVVPLGIETGDFRERRDRADGEVVVGFFGRICPEKGFHQIVEAFKIAAEAIGRDRLRLRTAGYLKDLDRPFFERQLALLSEWGLTDRFEHVGEVDRQGKVDFLSSLDVFSLPTVYREPKGLPVLEAMASGVPAVLPAHGGFPELVEATDGGLLVEPGSPRALADGIRKLVDDPELRRTLGRQARSAVLERRTADAMAASMAEVYERVLRPEASANLAVEGALAVG